MSSPTIRQDGTVTLVGGDVAVRTVARWTGPASRPLMTWVTAPLEGLGDSGVLLLPPVGYQWWTTHRTLRVLAERLAAQGHLVLRLDYDGTGDSAGDQWDEDRVAAWRAGARLAAAELRAFGCRRVTAVGARLGGTFALLDGAELGCEAVAAWAPVVTGRRYARELRLLSQQPPEGRDPAAGGGTVAEAGFVFTGRTLADIGALSAAGAPAAPAARVLLVDGAPDDELAAALRELGADVDAREVAGGESALQQPTEDAVVPEAIVSAICDWVGAAPPAGKPATAPAGRPAATVGWDGGAVRETVVRVGERGLAGVLTEPGEDVEDAGDTIVFLNTGAEPHVGPGRAWVEYARSLARRGHRCLRVDWRGWGESPDDGHAPGRPYDPHGEADTLQLLAALRLAGHHHLVLVGLCASAWIALRVVLRDPSAGVIALNPQLYWQQGDKINALMETTERERAQLTAREARCARFGLWSVLDLAGHRTSPARWLDDLRRSGARATFVFARGDLGLVFLRNRLGRRLARTLRGGRTRLVELEELDHSMHRVWAREEMLSTLDREARRLAAAPSRRA